MNHFSRLQTIALIVLSVFLGADVLLADTEAARIDRDINSNWRFLREDVPDARAVAFDDSHWTTVDLPHDWISGEMGKRGKTEFYWGAAWYRYHLHVTRELSSRKLFLRFGAASRVTDVYVNGQNVGTHKGAFAAFCFDISAAAHAGDNLVAVRVNNGSDPDVAPLSGDFTTYTGLYRGVHLLALNPICISPLDDAGPGVYLKSDVTADSANVEVTTKLLNSSEQNADVTVVCSITDKEGRTVQTASIKQTVPSKSNTDAIEKLAIAHPHLWDGRNDPYLYQATIEVRQGERVLDRVVQPLGLRFFKVDPNLGLFLNGHPYDFHGVNYHEGRVAVGFADTAQMEEQDNKLIVDMGCTGVRMAHYQHNDYEYTLCDKSGLIVWTELPLVNKMADTPAFRQNIQQQLRELIKQEYNHPSIFFWSMYNEPWVSAKGSKANTQEQWALIADLVSLAHQLDPHRLTTGAVVKGVEGPIDWYMDVTGTNRYDGWYDQSPDAWPKTLATLRSKYPDKCLGISEYGAGASIYQHESPIVRPVPASFWHPEEWQAVVHEHAWGAMEQQKWLWCKLVWCMFDFSSSGRNEGDRAGINDKGLVTADRKTCKDAYYYYKACWTKQPFVYITDRRFDPRPPGATELKVYSNCQSVDLEVDGHSLGRVSSSNHVFTWPHISLPQGTVKVVAVGTADGATYQDALAWKVSADTPGWTGDIR